jgi:hypothetical protein
LIFQSENLAAMTMTRDMQRAAPRQAVWEDLAISQVARIWKGLTIKAFEPSQR